MPDSRRQRLSSSVAAYPISRDGWKIHQLWLAAPGVLMHQYQHEAKMKHYARLALLARRQKVPLLLADAADKPGGVLNSDA